MKTRHVVVPLILLAAVAGFFGNQYWRKDSDLKISFPDMDAGPVKPIQPGQADCLPAPDAPASVIEYFQRFNKPLPERFCAKEAAPQTAHEPPQDSSQAEDAPDQSSDDDGPGDSPSHEGQYERDPGGGYQEDQGGGYQYDQDGYQDDRDHDGGDYWKNDDNEGGERSKGDGKRGKGHGTRKSACKKAHMKWNESTKTCLKRR